MREIKFRGKRLDNGEWVYGGLITDNKGNYGIAQLVLLNNCVTSAVRLIDPATVSQFTGLLDKDGKEIYEWDIVNVSFGETVVPMQVVFAFGGWKMKEQHDDTPHDLDCYVGSNDVEIIGNIHDNPELIKA